MTTGAYTRKGAYSGKRLILPQTSVSLSQKPQLLVLSCDFFSEILDNGYPSNENPLTFLSSSY